MGSTANHPLLRSDDTWRQAPARIRATPTTIQAKKPKIKLPNKAASRGNHRNTVLDTLKLRKEG